jgi:hypothetical protein
MEQVADISAAGQEIPRVLQDPKIRCHIDKNLIFFNPPGMESVQFTSFCTISLSFDLTHIIPNYYGGFLVWSKLIFQKISNI